MQREGKKEEKCESASCSCAGLYIFQRRVSLNPNKTVSDFHPVLACSGSFLPASPYTNRPLHFHVWVSFFLEQPTASCVREATEAPRSPATAAGVSGGRVPSGKWLRTGAMHPLPWDGSRRGSLCRAWGSTRAPWLTRNRRDSGGLAGCPVFACPWLWGEESVLLVHCSHQLWLCLLHR